MTTVNPKDIVTAAFNYLAEVQNPSKIKNVRVEELWPKTDDPQYWIIVLSYDAIGEYPFEIEKTYKEFTVDPSSQKVLSMKIREIGS